MNLAKRNPLNFPRLSNLFDDDWFALKAFEKNQKAAINVVEADNKFEVEVIVPGFKKEDINISIENNVLTVSAETKSETEESDKNYIRKEYNASAFTRSFSLPENADQENIAAKYNDGILKLTIEKTDTESSLKKEIQID